MRRGAGAGIMLVCLVLLARPAFAAVTAARPLTGALKDGLGVGPKVRPEEKKEEASPSPPTITTGPAFGVIPSVLVGGPLAVLSMLFPTWFGGWRRWLALISAVCTTSTVVFVYWLWGSHWNTTAFGSNQVQWVLISLVTLLCAVWAWRRHITNIESGQAPLVPSRVELIVLLIVSLLGLGAIAWCFRSGDKLTKPAWLSVLAMCIGAWAATGYVLWVRRGGDAPAAPAARRAPALATEVVMLTVMTIASVAFAGIEPSRRTITGGVQAGDTQSTFDDFPVKQGKLLWTFSPKEGGSIDSSPLIAGDRVYIGATRGTAFRTGVVYCLNRADGKEVWNTRKNIENMQNISVSSPVLDNGRLYIGEGFHFDTNCKVWCIDAATGEAIWSFQTASHTESSPFVTEGKVFIGAGDDGLYCLDAAAGKEVWHYSGGLHIDASPVVANGRLYVGAGVGDVFKEPAILCLDTATGKELWKHTLDVPAWGSPVIAGELVYFGIGNGRFDKSDESKPAGALLCVRARDGETAWRYDTPDSVLCRPSVDRSRVFFGSRDGHAYCADRKSGKLVWKRDCGSPMVTAAAAVRSPDCGATTSVFTLASDGQVYCFGANTGHLYWSFDLTGGKAVVTLYSSPAVEVKADKAGTTRQIIFGAALGEEGSQSPAVYCFEDRVEADVAEEAVESRP